MIERPASSGTGVVPADAGESGATQVASAPQFTASPIAEVAPAVLAPPLAGLEPPLAHELAGIGPDPVLAPPEPPKFADRTRAELGRSTTTTRHVARSTTRATARTENMKYRAIFACCTEAIETPTE